MKKLSLHKLVSVVAALIASTAFAAPHYEEFGQLDGFTAGGVPTRPVAFTTEGSLTLGLAAQQRYFNPALTNDGKGTYFATVGENNGFGSSSAIGATWNFNYYISNDISPTAADPYTYTLNYGLLGNAIYSINPVNIGDNGDTPGFGGQNSQNLNFFAYGNLSAFEINNFTTFDPFANADYEFTLSAFDANQGLVASTSIVVRVGTGSSVPDGGSTFALLGLASAGILAFRRRFAR